MSMTHTTDSDAPFNHDFLVVDTDALPVAGPNGPLIVTWAEGQELIAGREARGLCGKEIRAFELASVTAGWFASFGTQGWRLRHKSWK